MANYQQPIGLAYPNALNICMQPKKIAINPKSSCLTTMDLSIHLTKGLVISQQMVILQFVIRKFKGLA